MCSYTICSKAVRESIHAVAEGAFHVVLWRDGTRQQWGWWNVKCKLKHLNEHIEGLEI